jgi:hypothetical protein
MMDGWNYLGREKICAMDGTYALGWAEPDV